MFADGDYSVTININAWAAGLIAAAITGVGKLFHGYIRDNQKAAIDSKNDFKEMLVANTALTREVATALVTGSTALEKTCSTVERLEGAMIRAGINTAERNSKAS